MVTEQQLEARLAELVAQLRALFAGELDELLDDGEPRHGERVDRDTLRRYWPAGLPLPLTVGAALDAVEQGHKLIAAAVASDIRAAAAVLVDPAAREAVLARPELAARWTWRSPPPDATDVGPSHGVELALDLLRRRAVQTRNDSAHMGVADFARYGWSTPDLAPAVVIKWAGPRLDEAWRDRESEAAAWMRRRNARTALAWGEVVGPMVGDESAPDELLFYQSGKAEPGELLPPPSARLQADLALAGDFRRPLTVPRPDGLGCELSPGSVALLCWLESKALVALPETLDDAAWRAVLRWATKAPGDAHNAAAAAVLADNGDKDALRQLAAELCDRCNSLASATGALPPTPEGGGPRTSDDMLEIEAKLASWLERIDADEASKLREASRKRLAEYRAGNLDAGGLFKNWHNEGAAVLERIARVVWWSCVSERWERQQKNPPAAPAGVLDLLTTASYGSQIDLPLNGIGPANLKDRRGRLLAEFPQAGLDADTLTQMFAGRALLGTVAGTRLIRWELVTAHRQWLEMHGTGGDFRRTVIPGGWSGLAELVGEHSKATAGDLRAMVKAQAHGIFRLPSGGTGNLLGYDDKDKAGPGKPATLTMYWLDPLLPGYVHSLPPGRSGETHRRARVLVPLLDELPDLGHGRVAGAAALLHWLVLIDLAQGAPDLAKRGGVLLDWRKLWSDAGLSEDQGRRVRDLWTADGDNAPAMLEHVGGGRYTLGKTHERARAFILARNTLAAEKATKKRR